MSKKLNSDYYGRWTESLGCHHYTWETPIYIVRWTTTKMSSDFFYGLVEVGRIVAAFATLGISTWFNGGLKDLSHEFVEVKQLENVLLKSDNLGNLLV